MAHGYCEQTYYVPGRLFSYVTNCSSIVTASLSCGKPQSHQEELLANLYKEEEMWIGLRLKDTWLGYWGNMILGDGESEPFMA